MRARFEERGAIGARGGDGRRLRRRRSIFERKIIFTLLSCGFTITAPVLAAASSGAGMPAALAIPLLAAGGDVPRGGVAVDIHGGDPSARKVVSKVARDWSRVDGPRPSVEWLLARIGAALNAEGWGKGEVEVSVDSIPGGIQRCRIDLHGLAPARLSEWMWEAPEGMPQIPTGDWDPVSGDRRVWEIVDRTQERGYPFVSVQVVEASSSGEGMAVRARLREGPALKLRSLVFEGRGTTRQSYLERLSGLSTGEPIRPSRGALARDRIERSGLFSQVEGPWLRSPEGGEATLVYRLVPAPQNRAEGAVGYDGSTNSLSGFAQIDIGNLFGTGRRLAAAWERLGQDRSRLNLDYREPYLLGLPVAAEVSLAQEIEDSTWTVDDVRGVLDGDLGNGLIARLGIASHRTVQSGATSGRTETVLTIAGLGFDGRAEAGTRGSRTTLDIERGEMHRSPKIPGAEGTLLKLRALTERNQPIGGMGLVRLELSGAWVQGPDSLPRPEAVGLGGSATLRGYEEEVFRVLRYGLLRLEAGARVLPEGNRAYFFFDGALYRPWPDGKTKDATSYGVGFRLRGGGGWVRLDYGIPSGEAPLSGRIHFRLETGF
jgi:hypothetical protein